jgi:hypothetical protein
MTKNTIKQLEIVRNNLRKERDRLDVILMKDEGGISRHHREIMCDWRDTLDDEIARICRVIHNQQNLP